MADLTSRGRRANTPARLPALPASTATDPARRQWEELVREWLEVRLGARGDFYERAVTHRELEDALATAVSTSSSTDQTTLQGLVAQLQSQLFSVARQVSLVQSLVNTTITTSNTEVTNINTRLRDVAVEDVTVFAPQMRPTVTGGCGALTTIEFTAAKPNLVALPFSANVDTSADFHAMLPFAWAGRNFKVWVYWGHGGSGTAWDVAWEVTSNSTYDNEPITLDFQPGVLVTDTGGTSGNLYIALSGTVPIASYGNEEGSLVSLRIYRRGTYTEDTMDITAYLLAVRFTLEDIPLVAPGYAAAALLLHFDGNFTDSSANAYSVFPQVSAVTSSTRSKFGSESFIGNGNYYLTIPDNATFAFGSGLWSVDCWVFIPTSTTLPSLTAIAALWNGSNAYSWWFGFDNADRLVIYYTTDGTAGTVVTATSTAAITRNQWVHVAYWRSATDNRIKGAINGSAFNLTSAGAFTIFDPAGSSSMYIGTSQGLGSALTSGVSLDELRICKGTIDYDTANFAPPTSAYT